MESRIELRKKDFKKSIDDPRRRREEYQYQIRSQRRDALFQGKRKTALEDLSASIESNDKITRAKIAEMTKAIMSDDPIVQFDASQQFRRALSIESNPPIQEVIDAGVVGRFVEFLQDNSRPDLQFQAAWALTNIASGSREQTHVVVEHSAVPIFVSLLKSPEEYVKEQAIWALGNIAGDCTECRDLVLKEGALTYILNFVLDMPATDLSNSSIIKNAAWTLSNLCRGNQLPRDDKTVKIVSALRKLIDTSEIDLVSDACWALSYIVEGYDSDGRYALDEVLTYLDKNRLVQLLYHSSAQVHSPCLRAVGNIASGSDQQTQTMIEAGCIPALRTLLTTSSKKETQKEVCWTISNITAGNRSQIQEVINQGIIPILVNLYDTVHYDVQKEICWALANATSGGHPGHVEYLVKCDIIKVLVDCLSERDDLNLLVAVLQGLIYILDVGKMIQSKLGSEVNPYCVLLEQAKAFPKLELLQDCPEHSDEYKYSMIIIVNYLSYYVEEESNQQPQQDTYQPFGNENPNQDAPISFNFGDKHT